MGDKINDYKSGLVTDFFENVINFIKAQDKVNQELEKYLLKLDKRINKLEKKG